MREIKFRAYDHIGKEMYYGYSCYNPVPTGYATLEVMEYTGFKEKYNLINPPECKEIYEGDVIREDGWDTHYLIAFEDGKFIAKRIGRCNGNIFTIRDKNLDQTLFPVIVGNIYENPNLLK